MGVRTASTMTTSRPFPCMRASGSGNVPLIYPIDWRVNQGDREETRQVKERLGVAGGGVIACGLAAVASRHGDVVMWTRSAGSASRARESVLRVCGKLGEGAAPDRIEVTTEETALGRATFVVEAIAEDRRAKLGLLARL